MKLASCHDIHPHARTQSIRKNPVHVVVSGAPTFGNRVVVALVWKPEP
jgi:hypothetical protein